MNETRSTARTMPGTPDPRSTTMLGPTFELSARCLPVDAAQSAGIPSAGGLAARGPRYAFWLLEAFR